MKSEYISRWENDIRMLEANGRDQGDTDGQDIFTLLGNLLMTEAEHGRERTLEVAMAGLSCDRWSLEIEAGPKSPS